MMTGHIRWRTVDLQLRAIRTVWVSTTRPDGRPHSVPVWFLWEADDSPAIVFASGTGGQKVRNLAHQSWVIVHAGDGDDALILEGRAERIVDPADREALLHRYMEKYVDPGSGAQATFGADEPVYRVRIEHVMTWIYGDIRNRTDWHFG